MKLSELKILLANLSGVSFKIDHDKSVPAHFHITEMGMLRKHFIDCGGTVRQENKINFQLWYADDKDHRLTPAKLLSIITLAEEQLQLEDAEIEVEYQMETIGKYDLAFKDDFFILQNKNTACLAGNSCGIPNKKQRVQLIQLTPTSSACCPSESHCC